MTPAAAVRIEYAKLRRRRLPLIGFVVIGAGLLFSSASLFTATAQASFTDPEAAPWLQLMLNLALTTALTSPLLVAILGSRVVEIEHQGNGWVLARMAGRRRGELCRIKFLALTPLLVGLVGLQFILQIFIARAAGLTQPLDVGLWAGYAGCVLLVGLALLGLHICLSAWLENQLISLGLGVIGSFIGLFSLFMPPSLAHLLPWGYYAVSTPAAMTGPGQTLTATAPDLVGLAIFLAVFALGFWAATEALNRKDS
ncbi:ABC transporter permease [Paeniglutamicibacter antarcticus]